MKAVFIAGIEVRLALSNRSDALQVCCLRLGGEQIPVRIHRHLLRSAPHDADRCSSGSVARPVWRTSPNSCSRAGCRHSSAAIAERRSFALGSCAYRRALRHFYVDAELTASSDSRLACRPNYGSEGKPGCNRSTMTVTDIAAQKAAGTVFFTTSAFPSLPPSLRSELATPQISPVICIAIVRRARARA
jgi:hypothetical protein